LIDQTTMAFWNKSSYTNDAAAVQEQLETTQYAVSLARRRLLGALVLLALACSFIPWMLDSTPRPWGEDVILRMPKSAQPYQAKPSPVTKVVPLPEPNASSPVKPNAEAKP
jgi:cell division septation protein DedD